jgi:membrane protease YdiL (CAAX protease family)
MSPNSSRKAEAKALTPEDGAARRSFSLGRRVGLTILLPLWILAGFLLSLVLIEIAQNTLVMAGVPVGSINVSVQNAVLAALSYLLTAVIVIGLPGAIRKSRTTLNDLGLNRLPVWQDILLALAGFVVYFVCAGVLITLASELIPGFDAEETQEVGFDNLSRRYEYILAFVTLVVIAPVAEEVLMRGYLYGRLRRIAGVVAATVVTAVLFAVLHLQWNVAVDVFALSLVLTSLREVTGSIWASILVHMMKNGFAFYLLFINTELLHTIGG